MAAYLNEAYDTSTSNLMSLGDAEGAAATTTVELFVETSASDTVEVAATDSVEKASVSPAAGHAESSDGCAVVDPWASPEFCAKTTPWSELETKGKCKRVVWDYAFRQVAILGFLYLFICSLDFLSSSFRLVGGKALNEVFSNSEILSNPVTGVMIGVLATVLLQSSSTTTSIVVAMVGSDSITVDLAIPIVMGANIGTSVTNTLVSFGQVKSRDDFRRAFGGATVHDMFNWLTVLVLLPIEVGTGYLKYASELAVSNLDLKQDKDADLKLLSVLTDPLTKRVIQLDKKNLIKIATCKNCTGVVLAQLCPYKNVTIDNVTRLEKPCEYLFDGVAGVWSDEVIGAVLLTVSIVLLCACLVGLVKILQSTLRGTVASALRRVVNLSLPSRVGAYVTGYVYIAFGCVITILLQSSSVFTSALTPLVGLGVLPIDRAYALTLGSNVGTTATAILAALAGDSLERTLQIAFCHLFFNATGILLWYVVPALRFPVPLAKRLGNVTAEYRWFSVAYLVCMFIALPAVVFALSVPGWRVLVGVAGPVTVLLVAVAIVNVVQNKKPKLLPQWLQTWNFLPLWMHSLRPLDNLFKRCCCCCPSHCGNDDSDSSGERGSSNGDSEVERSGSVRSNDSSCSTHGKVAEVTADSLELKAMEATRPIFFVTSERQNVPPPSYREL